MRNKMMTKILVINLIFISKNRNLYYRPKNIQEEWFKNLEAEEKQILNSICVILTTDYFIYTTFSVLQ